MDWIIIYIVLAFSCAIQSQCPKDYSGPTCSCGPCYNNATCSPTSTGSSKCTCGAGMIGPRCRTVYMISFGQDSYLEMANNYLYDDEELSFRFKTTLPDGLLLYQEGLVQQERSDHVIIELVNGSLRLSYNTDTVTSQTAYVGERLHDGAFHGVKLVLQNRKPYQATLSVDTTQSVSLAGTQPVDFRHTNKFYVGGVRTFSPHVRNNLFTGKSFVGCIKDFIQGQLHVNFQYELPLSRNVHAGCSRKDVCVDHRCNHGTCVDLWTSYGCQCYPGYSSPYCEKQTSASFNSVDNPVVGYSSRLPITSISFQFNARTGSGQGVLMYSGVVNSFQIGTAIVSNRLQVVHGQPGNWRSTILGTNLTDGSWHHLKMIVNTGTITIHINSVSSSVIMVPSVNHIGYHLYFGAVSGNFSDLSQELNGSVFTGCTRKLSLNNVTVGLGSGQPLGTNPLPKPGCTVDKSCSSSMCGNRGTCRTTWGGMECRCYIGYHGDRCQNGTTATLNGNTSSLMLTLDTSYWSFGSSGSLKFRTRSAHGMLLYAGWFPSSQQDYLTLEISNRKLKMTVNLGSGEGSVVVNRIVADNQWHSLQWSRKYQKIVLALDGTVRAASTTPGSERLLNVARNGEIFVNISSPATSRMFEGCIKDLVFDTRNVNFLKPSSQPGLTVLSTDISTGCIVKTLCHGYLCQNGASCLEDTGIPRCSCVGNFTGTYCEECIAGHTGILCDKVIDLCAGKPCNNNGTCIFDPLVSIDNYSCLCSDGYTGRNCSTEIDECMVYSPCKNNARCTDGIANYSCVCSDGYTGRNCSAEVNECTDGMNSNSRCLNNGVCIDGLGNYVCNCTDTGYRGLHCEKDINECEVRTHKCKNGTCVNTPGRYKCECFKFFNGPYCDNNTKITTVELGNEQTSDTVQVVPAKYWWVIFIGLLTALMCTAVLFLYLRNKQTKKTEGKYLPGEEEMRMAKVLPIFGLIDEETCI